MSQVGDHPRRGGAEEGVFLSVCHGADGVSTPRLEGMLTEAQNARADELRMERERLANEAVGWEGGSTAGKVLAVVLALVNVLRDV